MLWWDSLGQFLITRPIGALILWHGKGQFCTWIFTIGIRYLSASRASFLLPPSAQDWVGSMITLSRNTCVWRYVFGRNMRVTFFLLTWTLLLSCTEVTIRLLRCNLSLIKERQHCKKQSIIWRKCRECGMGGILPHDLIAVELRPVFKFLWTSFSLLWGGHKYLPLLPLKNWCKRIKWAVCIWGILKLYNR